MGPTSLVQPGSQGAAGSRSATPTSYTVISANAVTKVEYVDARSRGLPGGLRPFISINYRLSEPSATAWVLASYTTDNDANSVDLGGIQIPPEPPRLITGPGFSFFAPIGASTVTIASLVQYGDGSHQLLTTVVNL